MKRIFSFLFRILVHPLAAILFNVLILYELYSEEKQKQFFYFSTQKPSSGGPGDLTMYSLVVYYAFVMGVNVNRLFRKIAIVPRVIIFAMPAIAIYIARENWFFYKVENTYIFLFYAALFFTSVGSTIIAIIQYLFSKRPGPLVSDIRAIPKRIASVGSALLSGFLWIGRHRLIVGLIVLQLAVNVFVLYQMADMESRLGSSLFSACNANESVKTVKNSIVRIASEEGEGTGMIIREDGYILTNAHVIAEDPSPKIIFPDYSFKTSNVIFRDKDKDIAVVKVDGTGYAPVTFADPEGLRPRTALYAVGYPLGTALRGDATVADYSFAAVRSIKDFPTDMVQLEGVGTGGSSGAPVVTACGQVTGMFTASTEGISLAVSSKSIQDTIAFLSADPSTWPKPPEYPLEPDKSAEEAVRAYYTFIKMRDFKRAYLMLMPERVRDNPLDNWVKGYAKTLDVTLVNISKNNDTPLPSPTITADETSSGILQKERVYVKIRSLDLEGQDVVVRFFGGTWIVVWDGEFWRLSDSNIQPVPEPGWDWFW